MITLKQQPGDEVWYKVFFENGKNLGEFVRAEDGYYVYLPAGGGGFWESVPIRAIADKLDELNKPWDDIVQRDLGRPKYADV